MPLSTLNTYYMRAKAIFTAANQVGSKYGKCFLHIPDYLIGSSLIWTDDWFEACRHDADGFVDG